MLFLICMFNSANMGGNYCYLLFQSYVFVNCYVIFFFFFSSRRRHTRFSRDWSSDVCSSDLRGRVEPHGVEVTAERLGHADRLELLVLQGVDQGDTADLGVDDVVEGLESFHRIADHQDQRVRDRARWVRVDQLRGLRHGDAVAAADERVPLDHRRERRVHPAGAERDHLAVGRGLLAARGLGRDPRGLAEQAEEGRLVLGPLDVGPLDAEHRLVGLEDGPFVHGPDVHRHALQERRGLLDAREDAPAPVLREALQIDLRLHALLVPAVDQDLDRAREIDVGNLAALDVGVGGGVEWTLRSVRHMVYGLFGSTPESWKSVSEAPRQVNATAGLG